MISQKLARCRAVPWFHRVQREINEERRGNTDQAEDIWAISWFLDIYVHICCNGEIFSISIAVRLSQSNTSVNTRSTQQSFDWADFVWLKKASQELFIQTIINTLKLWVVQSRRLLQLSQHRAKSFLQAFFILGGYFYQSKCKCFD